MGAGHGQMEGKWAVGREEVSYPCRLVVNRGPNAGALVRHYVALVKHRESLCLVL